MVQKPASTRRPPAEEILAQPAAGFARFAARHGVALASHDDDTAEKGRLMADLGAVISEFPVSMEAARNRGRSAG